MIQKLWHQLFLQERASISLSFFRLFVAMTVIFVMVPTFIPLQDTYLSTGYFEVNTTFFTTSFIQWIHQSPQWLIKVMVGVFCLSSITFLIGLFSQVSCIVVTLCCYYFYALNSFVMGTLSWDIFLVT